MCVYVYMCECVDGPRESHKLLLWKVSFFPLLNSSKF